jgi:hypothetical protein
VNEAEISRYITNTFEGVDVVVASDASFFFYNPDSTLPPDHRFPFVTLVTSDVYDQFSNLNRPSVFRLNIGIGKQTFRSLFGLSKSPSGREGRASDPREERGHSQREQLAPRMGGDWPNPERPSGPSRRDSAAESGDNAGNYNFTTLDQVMPHPVYGRMYWVCVLNPSEETFATNVQPLLAEAYELAVSKYNRQAARR